MTVVAAVARAREIVMVADTETNYAGTAVHRARKVLRIPVGDAEEALIAAAGAGGLLALARRRLALTPPAGGESLHEWAEEVAVSLTEMAATANPPMTVSDENGTRLDGALLLGFRGSLFYLFTSMAVEVAGGVAAIGSGTDVALGAMQVALGSGDQPLTACLKAVNWACIYSPGCSVDGTGPLIEALGAAS